eukprot:TRINITY_DN63_c0_g1_i4.p1 TRINITY_DN63_c0_g1~~TRINITY_DN63_c0_g1_i4.p1  ORF type:complete len:153 (-),score=10.16 TRINITY_DN63_c0_g1_i4:183-641(-)
MSIINRLVGLLHLVLYAVLAALIGRLLNNVFNGDTGYVNTVTLFLCGLACMAIISNGAWALVLLTHGIRAWRLGAALSAISGLLLLAVAAKHLEIGGGYSRLTKVTVAWSIIAGGISLLTGLALLLTRDHVVHEAVVDRRVPKTVATGHTVV